MAPAIVESLVAVPGKKTCTVQAGGHSFEVAQSVVDSLGLEVGAQLMPSQEQVLHAAARKRAAAAAALRYLRGRPRTAHEVARHLSDRGHTSAAAGAVLDELRAQGVVDDGRFASWYVEARLGHRPTGRARLVQEMTERGIDRDLAERIATQHIDADAEWDLARRAARRRQASLQGLPPDKTRRRLAGFLTGRGFPLEIVRTICLEEMETSRDRTGD